jgi:hypothetical protein
VVQRWDPDEGGTRRTFPRALLAALAAALVPVGIAGADNSVGFVDTVGDAGASIDITRVDIESSDHGWLSFKISAGATAAHRT